MFRRLAALTEHFNNEGVAETQTNTVRNQTDFYNVKVPNLIPSVYNAPPNLTKATQSVDPRTSTVRNYLPNMPQIFRPGMDNPDKDTDNRQAICTTTPLDELIRNYRPSDPVRCGWLYTPNPNPMGGPPILSRGFLGTGENQPISELKPPAFTRFFWNLEEAKQQIMTDTCKALTSCNDLTDPQFAGCGFSTERGAGIPIKKNGSAAYPDNMLTNSATSAIIQDANSEECKSQGSTPSSGTGRIIIPGSTAAITTLCTPNDSGLLSIPCLRDLVINKVGCSNDGAIANALATSDPKDPMGAVAALQSFQVYNQRSKEDQVLNYNLFRDGKATQTLAIQEFYKVKQASEDKSKGSALAAAARDLCLNEGSYAAFDFCDEIQPATPIATLTETQLGCLQKQFLKRGGTPQGLLYPSSSTVGDYQRMGTYGAALQSMDKLNALAKSPVESFADIGAETEVTYRRQATALQQLRGLRPDLIPERAPESQGIEIFWYSGLYLVKNTIEPIIPYLQANATVPIDAKPSATGIVAITDIRTGTNEPVNLYIAQPGYFTPPANPMDGYRNNNYTLSLNMSLPPKEDATAPLIDKENQFRIGSNNITNSVIKTKSCWTFLKGQPNILKMAWSLTNPAIKTQRLYLGQQICNNRADPIRNIETGTITREKTGPFLMYELVGQTFADLRCGERFSATLSNTSIFNKSVDIMRTPGTRGYLQLTNNSSSCSLSNIGLTSWTTTTFAFRLVAVPVTGSRPDDSQNSLFTFFSDSPVGKRGLLNLKVTRSGTQASLTASHLQQGTKATIGSGSVVVDLSTWYLGVIHTMNSQWSLSFYNLEQAKTMSALNPTQTITLQTAFNFTNEPLNSTRLVMGGSNASGFTFDLAWWHFFVLTDLVPTVALIKREANNDWKITV